MKKWLFVCCVLFLAACTNEKNIIPEKNAQGENELPKSAADWLTFAHNSEWFAQSISKDQIIFEEMVDFEGDNEPEYVVATKQDYQHYTLSIVQFVAGQWQQWYEQTYTNEAISELTNYSTLTFNQNKNLFMYSYKTDGTSDFSETIIFLIANKTNDRIVKAHTLNIKHGEQFSKTMDGFELRNDYYTRTVNIANGFMNEEYVRQAFADGELIVSNDLTVLFGKSLNDAHITFEDTYEEAQQKAGPPLDEQYIEGSLCSLYEDYYFCLNQGEPQIAFASISVNGVTLEEVENIIGRPLTIHSYESGMNDNATEFFTQFEYNNRFYSLTLDGPQHTSKIHQVHVSTIEYLY